MSGSGLETGSTVLTTKGQEKGTIRKVLNRARPASIAAGVLSVDQWTCVRLFGPTFNSVAVTTTWASVWSSRPSEYIQFNNSFQNYMGNFLSLLDHFRIILARIHTG